MNVWMCTWMNNADVDHGDVAEAASQKAGRPRGHFLSQVKIWPSAGAAAPASSASPRSRIPFHGAHSLPLLRKAHTTIAYNSTIAGQTIHPLYLVPIPPILPLSCVCILLYLTAGALFADFFISSWGLDLVAVGGIGAVVVAQGRQRAWVAVGISCWVE